MSAAALLKPSDVPWGEIAHHRAACERLDSEQYLFFWKSFTRKFVADDEPNTPEQNDWLFRHGFTPEKWGLYRFDERDPKDFLSDVQRERTRLANGPFDIVFNNKILFTQVFARHAKVPAVVAVWRAGRMVTYDDVWERVKTRRLNAPLRLVAKPVGGGGGGGIYFLRCDNRQILVESNDAAEKRRKFEPERIEELFADARVPFMVTEYLVQGEYAKTLYPLTVNTLRVLVIRDPETLKPHIVRAVQRIGTAESYPIDNFSLGGLSTRVDLDTGLLGQAVPAAGSRARQFMTHHPDTHEPITGKLVPNWQKLKRDLSDLFYRLPYITYCGFDLVVTDDGYSIIEGNSFSQVRLFQMHEPLLTDPMYRKFLRHMGIYLGDD